MEMTDKGKISVIVPIYNAVRFIPSLVRNFDSQTCRDFELIMVNDRSTDGTWRMMREFAASRPYIACVDREANGGQGAARNSGLDAATGDYVMFVDQDDCFAEDYLEIMRYVIDRDNADIGLCGTVFRFLLRTGHAPIFYDAPKGYYKACSGREAIENFLGIRSELHILGTPWSKIARRSFYERARLRFPETVGEDIVMSFKEFSLAGRVACYNSELYTFSRLNLSAQTRAGDSLKRVILETHHIPDAINSFAAGGDLPEEIRTYAVMHYFSHYVDFCTVQIDQRRLLDNYQKLLSAYHETVPPFDRRDAAHYIFFHLHVFYLIARRSRRIDLFADFVRPFRAMLQEWVSGSGSLGFSGWQEDCLQRFIAAGDDKSDRGGRSLLLEKLKLKLLSLLFRHKSCLSSKYIARALTRLAIRQSGWFDDGYFESSNPELVSGGKRGIDYFIDSGWLEHRNPNRWFDVESFMRTHREARKTGINPLVYFYLFGRGDKRVF
jgi:glycosyltransferase involved in cell wall biosynthesis